MPDDSLTEHLIASVCASSGRFSRHEAFIHDILCLSVSALDKQFPDLAKTFRSVRVSIVCLASAPHGYLVEDDVLLHDSSVHHHTEAAVADRQHLFPCLCRGVVPKLLLQFSLCLLHVDVLYDKDVR